LTEDRHADARLKSGLAMMRIATPLIALLLCGTALAGCASDNGAILGSSNKAVSVTGKTAQTDAAGLPTDVESGVHQAQLQRLAGHYDEAIHTLSQIMLVASDDPRVIGEYGKTLAEKGRAQDAVQFLSRATELQPSDWSLYSALGVAYDQIGDQASARTAYEHALKLKPNDPSVLNNYALSRMLANDPETARQLVARAQSAGGAADPKIARNIEMVNRLAPEAVAQQKAAAASTPVAAPVSAPATVTSQPLPPAAASAAQNSPVKQAQQHPAPQVVMQTVPVDPLAGPVKPATHGPTPLATHATAKVEAKNSHPVSEKSATVASASKPDIKADAKTAAIKTDTKTAKAEPVVAKPVAADIKTVKAADTKPEPKSEAKPASKSNIPALRQTASAY
jgi:Flp pilus assembly protein TadD